MATRMPRCATRTQVQQQLELSVSGQYLNNIEHHDLVRHLLVGTNEQYVAALFIERTIEAVLDAQEDRHAEEIEKVEKTAEARLDSVMTALENVEEQVDCGRMTIRAAAIRIKDITAALQFMIDDEIDLADALDIVTKARALPEAEVIAPPVARKKRAARPAKR